MPAYDPLDLPSWYNEVRSLILDDGYLAELRERAARYHGPEYEEFGNAVRQAVLTAAGFKQVSSAEWDSVNN
jgi:hypothetical protein